MKNKTCIPKCVTLGASLLVSVSAYADNLELIGKKHNLALPIESRLSDDIDLTWWSRHYVAGLGLAPFSTGIKPMPMVDNQPTGPLLGYGKGGATLERDVNKINDAVYYPLADVIPVRTDDNPHLSGTPYLPLIFFRLQDDLNSKPHDAQPGSIVWTNDREAGTESTMINAALLMDMYFPGFGRMPGKDYDLFGFSSDNMFHLLLGAELEKFDSSGGSGTAEVDIRRYSALMEFSPGALLNLPNKWAQDKNGRAPRQTMTLGWVYEDDVVQDVQRNSFQFRYAPFFNLYSDALNMFVGARSYFKKRGVFYSEKDLEGILKGKESGVATKESAAEIQADRANAAAGAIDENTFNSYFYMRPKVGLEYGSISASSVLDGEIPDVALNYLIETGFSFAKESFQIGYRLNGVSGIGDNGNHMSHEFFAQVTPHGWPGKIFCTYKRGELAPSYVNVDVLQIGLGVKF